MRNHHVQDGRQDRARRDGRGASPVHRRRTQRGQAGRHRARHRVQRSVNRDSPGIALDEEKGKEPGTAPFPIPWLMNSFTLRMLIFLEILYQVYMVSHSILQYFHLHGHLSILHLPYR